MKSKQSKSFKWQSQARNIRSGQLNVVAPFQSPKQQSLILTNFNLFLVREIQEFLSMLLS